MSAGKSSASSPIFRDLPPRVVIAEDADVDRQALAEFLSDLGYRVQEAGDGIACVKLVRAHVPDALVLDIDMPNMDGLEVLRRLRAHVDSRAVYVIVTSGHVGARDRQLAFEAGCNQYIVKPFTPATLAAALHAYFWKVGAIIP